MLKPSQLLKNTLGLLNTPGNIITAVILFCGAVATVMRFGWGIGAVTNLDDYYPWGLWIGFDLLCGVALAAGGFTLAAGYYIFGFTNLRSMDCHTRMKVENPRANDCQSCHIKRDPAEAPVW